MPILTNPRQTIAKHDANVLYVGMKTNNKSNNKTIKTKRLVFE